MADNNDIKRLNYFTGQFLEAQDFQDEQSYHIGMRRRLNQLLYSPGVIDGGFVVTKIGDKRIEVSPGFAIDTNGRELILLGEQQKDVTGFADNATVFVAVRYADADSTLPEDNRATDNITGFIRTTEKPEILLQSAQPTGNDLGIALLLAKLQLDANSNIQSVDISVRQLANLHFNGNKVGIGTANPVATLEISKSLTASQDNETLVSMKIAPTFQDNGKTGVNHVGLLVADGNVGIGKASPGVNLQVAGLVTASKNNDLLVGLKVTTSFRDGDKTGVKHLGLMVTDGLSVLDGGLSVLDGNVGIGTARQAAKLTVSAPNQHLQLRREISPSGGKQVFLELFQDDNDIPSVPAVAPCIQFNHKKRFLNRIEAKDTGFHFKGGELEKDDYLNITAFDVLMRGGNLKAVGAKDTLRIVCGTVDADGEVKFGSGTFTAIGASVVGVWDIVFNPPFSAIPAVTVTQIFNGMNQNTLMGFDTNSNIGFMGGDPRDNAVITYLDKNRVRVKTGGGDGRDYWRCYSFIAIGLP